MSMEMYRECDGPLTTDRDSYPDDCPDCGVLPGQRHVLGCSIEQCPNCGEQLDGCFCEERIPSSGHLPWSGTWPGKAECREWGWYARRLPGMGWVPRSKDDPGAVEDLDRLYREAHWDREKKRYVRDETEGSVSADPVSLNYETVCKDIDFFVNYDLLKLKIMLVSEVGPAGNDFIYYFDDSPENAREAVLEWFRECQEGGWAFTDQQIRVVLHDLDDLWTKDRKFKRRLKEHQKESRVA